MLGQVDFSTIYPVPLLWDNPQMAGPSDLLRERLRERLDAAGKSPHAVSRAIGANPGYVRDLLDPEKTSTPSAVRLQALAGELDTTTDYLLGRMDTIDGTGTDRLNRHMAKLSAEDLDMAENFIQMLAKRNADSKKAK